MIPMPLREMEAYFDKHIAQMTGCIEGQTYGDVSVVPSFYTSVDITKDDCLVIWERGPILEGRYHVVAKKEFFYGGDESQSYEGEPMEDPHWEDLMVEAERQIRATRDRHHVYLENFHVAATPMTVLASACSSKGVPLLLTLGS